MYHIYNINHIILYHIYIIYMCCTPGDAVHQNTRMGEGTPGDAVHALHQQVPPQHAVHQHVLWTRRCWTLLDAVDQWVLHTKELCTPGWCCTPGEAVHQGRLYTRRPLYTKTPHRPPWRQIPYSLLPASYYYGLMCISKLIRNETIRNGIIGIWNETKRTKNKRIDSIPYDSLPSW